MSNSSANSRTSELRKMLWPIESFELKKFLPMAAMMFCILFNYSMLRSIKDGFVVSNVGAEAISFLKMYVVLPSAILAMIGYAKLCNVMNAQKVFYTVTTIFVSYLVVFTFFVYPNPELFHPTAETVEGWVAAAPAFKWFIRIAGSWSYATFYVMAELWGSMMLSLLFWQFANQITKTDEAKRFYSMFGLLGNVALVLVGPIGAIFITENILGLELKLIPVLSMTIASAILIMLIYGWMQSNVLTDKRFYDPEAIGGGKKKKKAKLSLVDSFKMIFTSKYIGLIAVLVLSYGVSINLVEGIWKAKIKELYPTTEAYTAYMLSFQSYQGFAAIFFMLVGSNILRRVTWEVAAIFTPLMILLTGLTFFTFIFFGDAVSTFTLGLLTAAPLKIAVMVGMAQNVLSKAVKYSLFDSTKEMAYIPLDDELKTKGKAAVDVVGGRLGKSGGGFIQSSFFLLVPVLGLGEGTFAEATPFFAFVFFFIVVAWAFGVRALGKEYRNITKDHSY